ncbi:MAG: hypothetical protein ACJAVL_000114 [Bacteroidia bacterium]
MRKVRFHSRALDKHFEVERIIGEYHGKEEGPVLVFFGGIHGNEPSGVVALIEVMDELHRLTPNIKGSIYAITGNMSALEKEQRYLDQDLNRIWTKDRIRRIEKGELNESNCNAEEREQLELFSISKEILAKHEHQVYCIDLHTTSAPTVPFITLNDTLVNRKFATKFPMPVIIGIEEFLKGPLLSWVMEIGYPSLAFEAGEHHSIDSIKFHKAFVWLSLANGGLVPKSSIPDFDYHKKMLTSFNPDLIKVFEVNYKYGITPEEKFKMKPGFENLQHILKNELLAENSDGPILSPTTGRVFMPLYQPQGEDGFFIAKKVSPFWLNLSAILRKISFESVLIILPGMKRDARDKHTLVVHKRVAKFLAVDIFHLLGYRTKERTKDSLRVSKREYDVRGVAKHQ